MLNLSTLRRRTSSGFAASPTPSQNGSFPRGLGSDPDTSISFHWDGTRAVFTLNGQERWVIDPVLFGGRPRLNVSNEPNSRVLILKDAFFPGTTLTADFHCRLERLATGWQMELQLALAGARLWGPFANWLNGLNPLRTLIREDWHAEAAGGEIEIDLHRGDTLTFSPSWILMAEGSARARLNRRKEKLSATTIRLALLSPDEPSLMRNPDRKRTRIDVQRREADWNVKADIELPNGASLSTVKRSFDQAQVEISESKNQVSRGVLLFESLDPKATMICRPNTHHDSSAGIPFALALQGARYAFTLNESQRHVAVFANFSNQTQHLQIRENFLKVGVGTRAQTFELVALDGKLQTVKCSPHLLDLSLPLAGPNGHQPLNTRLDRGIQRLLATIDRSPHHKLSLNDMARLASLSPSRLRHKFKSQVGVTPTVYLQNARLKLAERLLKNGNLSIKEVRAAVGFESDSYFTRLYERFYGQSPSEMKNSWTPAGAETEITRIARYGK